MDSGYTLARPIKISRNELLALQRTPRFKAQASRILNDQAREIKQIAEQLAEQDLRRRPDDRRTEASKAYGREYHDSFEIITAREMGDGIRVAIRNTHPAARMIENGTPAHTIAARPTGKGVPLLTFPFDGPHGKGGPGRRSNWLLEGPPLVHAPAVKHPGSGAFKIMARAVRTYRRRHAAGIRGATQV